MPSYSISTLIHSLYLLLSSEAVLNDLLRLELQDFHIVVQVPHILIGGEALAFIVSCSFLVTLVI